jgi:hypothetical protein
MMEVAMKTLVTEVTIDATPQRVWAVLVDFSRYAGWNPFIVEAEGLAERGAALRLRMKPPGGRAATLKPRITTAVREETLEWVGSLGVPALFSGRHRFELRPTETGTHLVQRETFTGVLVPFLAGSLDAHTLPGLASMNDAIKRRSERAAVAG